MRRPNRAGLQLAVAVAVLALLLRRFGDAPFVAGLHAVDTRTLVLGLLLAVPVTVCSAWRWQLVARALGDELPLSTAVAGSYRAQLLNATLPGGVLGDVHRGVRQGGAVGDRGRGLRGVAWERTIGQVVQLGLAAAVLTVLPSPARGAPRAALVAGALGVFLVLVAAVTLRRPPGAVLSRALATGRADLRLILGRRSWQPLLLASSLAVAGHLATFVVAARTAGVMASTPRILPLALLVLVAMAIPLNVAGWGAREAAAAWAFGAAGLTADRGIATAVVHGVMVLAGSMPGAVVLLAGAWRRPDAAPPAVPQPAGSRHG